jgi:hypothetical protein
MSVNAPIPAVPPVAPAPTLDHERLEVYQRALEFHTLVLTFLPPRGFRTLQDKRRFYEMARGSMTESAAVLDVLRVRRLLKGA